MQARFQHLVGIDQKILAHDGRVRHGLSDGSQQLERAVEAAGLGKHRKRCRAGSCVLARQVLRREIRARQSAAAG